jgi:DNA-binding transcriptional MerR regulator
VSTTTTPDAARREDGLLTIGAVCRLLEGEFSDISISKIRYLEEQGLVTPKRTRGGYRLFAQDDVERLRRILELQRDEFLPLRVIRQQLESESSGARRRRRAGLLEREEEVRLGELCERAAVRPELARELEEYGLLRPRVEGGEKLYGETDVEIALACGRLARFGVEARHLRAFRSAADRVVSLIETVVAPALRSRNPERRRAGLEDLEALSAQAQELSQLLVWRELRSQAPLEWR